MLEMSVIWLRVATALYAVGLLHAILMALRRRSSVFRVALVTFSLGVVIHFVSLTELTIVQRQLPLNNFYETVSACAFLIALAFLFVYWRYQFTSLSVVLFPLVFLMTQTGAMAYPVATWSDDRLRKGWLLVHVMLILLGYAALLQTAVVSVFYLIQERQLKAKRAIAYFDRLPPLAILDNLITKSMGVAFVFITLGVIAASTWAFVETGTRWIGDPKVAISFVTWGLCLGMICLRAVAGWRGRKAALMALVVLGSSALTWAAHVGLSPRLLR